jgi:uncharacterized protein YjiS (DUF1127 family)
MSTIFDHTTDLRGMARVDAVWVVHIVRRCWQAVMKWRAEQAAVAQLSSMSDRELKDMGLTRSEIGSAVRGELAQRAFTAFHPELTGQHRP